MKFTNVCSRLIAAAQVIQIRQAESDPKRSFGLSAFPSQKGTCEFLYSLVCLSHLKCQLVSLTL